MESFLFMQRDLVYNTSRVYESVRRVTVPCYHLMCNTVLVVYHNIEKMVRKRHSNQFFWRRAVVLLS